MRALGVLLIIFGCFFVLFGGGCAAMIGGGAAGFFLVILLLGVIMIVGGIRLTSKIGSGEWERPESLNGMPPEPIYEIYNAEKSNPDNES